MTPTTSAFSVTDCLNMSPQPLAPSRSAWSRALVAISGHDRGECWNRSVPFEVHTQASDPRREPLPEPYLPSSLSVERSS
jgi:hypothetical protein